MDRLKACRDGLDKLDENVTAELNKFSIDVKHFADYQASTKMHNPTSNVFYSVRRKMLLSLATKH